MGMGLFSCYGLTIESLHLQMPELSSVDDSRNVDVAIRFGKVERGDLPIDVPKAFRSIDPNTAILYYAEAGTYLVRDGREIVIDPLPEAEEGAIRAYLLGPIMSMVAHQRGLLVLHASAVIVGEAAVAFMGMSGMGKSTIAAAFAARGHAVLSDDVIAISVDPSGRASVSPGSRQLKLSDESAVQLGSEKSAHSVEIASNFPKRGWRVAGPAIDEPIQLKRIYELQDAPSEEEIINLSPPDAFAPLLRNSYLLGVLEATGTQKMHFQQVAKVASGLVAVKTLRRRRSLAALPEVVRRVEEDLAGR
jgi:hypothetical protein